MRHKLLFAAALGAVLSPAVRLVPKRRARRRAPISAPRKPNRNLAVPSSSAPAPRPRTSGWRPTAAAAWTGAARPRAAAPPRRSAGTQARATWPRAKRFAPVAPQPAAPGAAPTRPEQIPRRSGGAVPSSGHRIGFATEASSRPCSTDLRERARAFPSACATGVGRARKPRDGPTPPPAPGRLAADAAARATPASASARRAPRASPRPSPGSARCHRRT